MNLARQFFSGTLVMAAFLCGCRNASATDDLVVSETSPAIGVQEKFGGRQIVAPRIDVVQQSDFDQRVFGSDANSARQIIEYHIERRIHEVESRYPLSEEKRRKLALAARTDKMQFFRDVDDLRRKFDAASGDIDQLELLETEIAAIRQKQRDPLGPNSFFVKSTKGILEGESKYPQYVDIDERQFFRHLSNVESAIRAVERKVALRERQRETLVKLLMEEISPPKVFGDFDDIRVKYCFAQLSEERLKPFFGNNQWPRVREVLDEFLEFRPSLVRRDLIDDNKAEELK